MNNYYRSVKNKATPIIGDNIRSVLILVIGGRCTDSPFTVHRKESQALSCRLEDLKST